MISSFLDSQRSCRISSLFLIIFLLLLGALFSDKWLHEQLQMHTSCLRVLLLWTDTMTKATFLKRLFYLFSVHCHCLQRALDPIIDGCEPQCSCWELNSGPLEEHSVLLTPEPSLRPIQGNSYKDNIYLGLAYRFRGSVYLPWCRKSWEFYIFIWTLLVKVWLPGS